MKTGFAVIVLTLAVAGCGSSGRYSEAWQKQKAACAGGDYMACAEIGHQARAEMGGTTLEQRAKTYMPLSTPIID